MKEMNVNPLIRKKIVYSGQENVPEFPAGSKVKFHFTTKVVDGDGVGNTIDDSRKFTQPMELLIGKQFKLEVWESIIKTMAVKEVAEFHVHSSLCVAYPIVAKTLRDSFLHQKHNHDHKTSSHCCGAMAMANGPKLGYDDLNNLMEKPSDLVFTMELLSFDPPESYKKEPWQMDETEKMDALPKLREDGNHFYKENNISEASKMYSQALGILEQLLLKEKPGDEDWIRLDAMKVPFLLNYSQCQLLLGNYYEVIEQCSQVLQREPDNVKALYRRGIANLKAWNPNEAEKDLKRVAELDGTMKVTIQAELHKLEETRKKKNQSDSLWLKKAFSQS